MSVGCERDEIAAIPGGFENRVGRVSIGSQLLDGQALGLQTISEGRQVVGGLQQLLLQVGRYLENRPADVPAATARAGR